MGLFRFRLGLHYLVRQSVPEVEKPIISVSLRGERLSVIAFVCLQLQPMGANLGASVGSCKMRGPQMALTDTAIRRAKPSDKPFKVTDSNGLYLLINPSGSKPWRVKYRMKGVERK